MERRRDERPTARREEGGNREGGETLAEVLILAARRKLIRCKDKGRDYKNKLEKEGP